MRWEAYAMGLKLALAAVVILCCALAGRAVAAGSLRRAGRVRRDAIRSQAISFSR